MLSKNTLWVCCILLACCVGVAKWHHSIDVQEYEVRLDGDVYCMNLLAERLEDQERYIKQLEAALDWLNFLEINDGP